MTHPRSATTTAVAILGADTMAENALAQLMAFVVGLVGASPISAARHIRNPSKLPASASLAALGAEAKRGGY